MKRSEVDIAKAVVKYLKGDDMNYEVYQEVSVVLDGETISVDIVGIRDDRLVVSECKVNLNREVVAQAHRVARFADEIVVAVSEPHHRSKMHNWWRQQLVEYGIGLIYVRDDGELCHTIKPRNLLRLEDDLILNAICDRQQHGLPAGSAAGKRSKKDEWEPVRTLLKNVPGGMTASEIGQELELSAKDRKRFADQAFKRNIDGIAHDGAAPARYRLKEAG